jgi:DNA-binding LytR/AlgR family response regulator
MNIEIEILENQFHKAIQKIKKVKIAIELIAKLTINEDYSKVTQIGEMALSIADEIRQYDLCFLICKDLAYSHTMMNNDEKSFYQSQKVILYAEMSENCEYIASAYNIAALVSTNFKKYKDAVWFYLKSIDICIENKLEDSLTTLYNNIGSLSNKTGNYKLALQYLKRGIKVNTSRKLTKANILSNIAVSYLQINDYSLSHSYAKRAISLYEELNYLNGLPLCWLIICHVEYYRKNYNKAKIYADLVIQKTTRQHLQELYDQAIIMQAVLTLKTIDNEASIVPKSVEINIKKANEICEKMILNDTATIFYLEYSEYLFKKKLYIKSIEYKNKYITLQEKIMKNDAELYQELLNSFLIISSSTKRDTNKSDKKINGLTVNIQQKTIFILFSHILYIEILNHDIHIFQLDGQLTRFRGSLSKIAKELDNRFLQPNQSFIVNMEYILSIGRKVINLRGDVNIPCTKKLTKIKNIYLKWLNSSF